MPREQREERLLAEYLARHHQSSEIRTRVRLGPTPLSHSGVKLEEAEEKLLRNFARWADALVIRNDSVTIIEAEVLPSPGVVSQLELYRALFKNDPTFSELQGRPVHLLAVWGVDDPALRAIAENHAVRVVIFTPTWLGEALRARFKGSLATAS